MEANGYTAQSSAGGRHRIIVRTAISILSVAALAGTAWLVVAERTASAPIRASDQFIHAMFNKEIDKAYAMTSESFQRSTSRDEFAEVANMASSSLKLDTLQVQAGEIEELETMRKAQLTYTIKGGSDEYEMIVTVVKVHESEDKRWLIHGVTNASKSGS